MYLGIFLFSSGPPDLVVLLLTPTTTSFGVLLDGLLTPYASSLTSYLVLLVLRVASLTLLTCLTILFLGL
jgi:hypothetical protein